MKNITVCLTALAAASLISGCAMGYRGTMDGAAPIASRGLLYTHTLQPLTIDMHQTGFVNTDKTGDIKHVGFHWASVAWDSAAIGDIAKKNGLHEIYFADLEVLNVLMVWHQYTVHVYGK